MYGKRATTIFNYACILHLLEISILLLQYFWEDMHIELLQMLNGLMSLKSPQDRDNDHEMTFTHFNIKFYLSFCPRFSIN